jgi:hypothetical protein
MENQDLTTHEMRHNMNNELAIIGSFLALCHTIESDETFKACLQNAEESLRRVIEKVGRGSGGKN